MPSPFPGMDPYLESPGRWPGVHTRLITAAADLLTEQLRPRYFVDVQDRVYVSHEGDPGRSVIVPDLFLTERAVPLHVGTPAKAAVGVLDVAQPIELKLVDDEIHEPRLAIIDTQGMKVVTIVEVISLTNKIWGSRGRENYDEKRADVNASSTHLVEIDLLRDGTPLYAKGTLPPHDYLVHVGRVEGRRRRNTFWPISLQQRLPVIAVPLSDGNPDAQLDLQRLLDTVYDRGGYESAIDYTRPPLPPLSAEQMEWARSVLSERAK
jgi:hypothetical protein